MTVEEEKQHPTEQMSMLIAVVVSGLFLVAGFRWMDRHIPHSLSGTASYALLPPAAIYSAFGLVRFIRSRFAWKKI